MNYMRHATNTKVLNYGKKIIEAVVLLNLLGFAVLAEAQLPDGTVLTIEQGSYFYVGWWWYPDSHPRGGQYCYRYRAGEYRYRQPCRSARTKRCRRRNQAMGILQRNRLRLHINYASHRSRTR